MDDDIPPIKIQGCPVHFPYKAYPSQLSMMNRIIQSLLTKQNCLLESPTGSGKTLSLLCSTLGWLRQEAENRDKRRTELVKQCAEANRNALTPSTCCTLCSNFAADPLETSKPDVSSEVPKEEKDCKPGWEPTAEFESPSSCSKRAAPDEPCTSSSPTSKKARFHDHECDDDFKADTSLAASFSAACCDEKPKTSELPVQCDDNSYEKVHDDSLLDKTLNEVVNSKCLDCPCHANDPFRLLQQLDKEKRTKVYYGTRTHNQIAQLIRELKKTQYRYMNSTVLSSRYYTCVNSYVRGQTRMNDICRDLIADSACSYYNKVPRLNDHSKLLEEAHLDGAFDIEELVFAVKEAGACPYYTARELIRSADIVFCPYQYLLEPSFRDAVGLSLTGHIVIFDEAHNIETTSCESVSFAITKEQLEKAKVDLEGLVKMRIKESDHRALLTMTNDMLTVIDLTRPRLIRQNYEGASLVWTGPELIALLEHVGLGPGQLSQIKKHYVAVAGLNEEKRDEPFKPKRKIKQRTNMESATSNLLSSLFLCLGIMFKENMRFSGDYRVALVESTSYERTEAGGPSGDRGQWMSKRRSQDALTEKQELTLNFWCLNPEVAFEEIAKQTRSIILTSGTLSPLNSFASELAMEFPLRLEANHVVRNDQTLVAAVGRAPNGGELCATFQYYETFRFQDDLGSLVLAMCQAVPHGVLCFVASYSLADKLMRRWEDTGMLESLRRVKHVVVEPRKGAEVADVLHGYYDAVAATVDGPTPDGCTGAFMMAVCRGKMSEGQDFADHNARLVLTVGIPYPNVKITKISLKRSYNDQNQGSRNLLTGSQWYEVQAFRALNQSLGRCIRHRHDWGAVIMVDVRLCNRADRYMPNISKWLRQRVELFPSAQQLLRRLADFVALRKEAERNGEVVIHFRRGEVSEDTE